MRYSLAVLIVVITSCSILVPSVWSQASSADLQEGTAEGEGMGAASAAATILYFSFKAAFDLVDEAGEHHLCTAQPHAAESAPIDQPFH